MPTVHPAVHFDDPLAPHRHDPNSQPVSDDPTILLALPHRESHLLTANDLLRLPRTVLPDCYIVSTGHGTSGPFVFAGVSVLDLLESYLNDEDIWSQVEIVSVDGFGTRLYAAEIINPDIERPPIISCILDGQQMARKQGLVRLIVPSETDDALKQIKWIERITVK